MIHPTPTEELPKSLRDMMAEAKAAVERWSDDPDDAADEVDASKEWATRLSQGEYDEALYWNCVAEDSEEAGDWATAKNAYLKVIDLDPEAYQASNAHTSIATLCSIEGNETEALEHYHAASTIARASVTDVPYRHRLIQEAFQLLKLRQVRSAMSLLNAGLATIENASDDELGFAKLKVGVASCQLEQRKPTKASHALTEAWSALEALRTRLEEWGTEDACGLHSGYRSWWRAEAKRRRLEGNVQAEIEAWQKSLEHAKRGAAGWNRVGWEIAVIHSLDSLADAFRCAGQNDEGEKSLAEAMRIRTKWHLPANVNSPDSPNPSTGIWKWLRQRIAARQKG